MTSRLASPLHPGTLDAKTTLLEAAKRVLSARGYGGLSTRAVAAEAQTQMSQIRYHFGSKEGMILALFDYMNAQLIERQTRTFSDPGLSFAEKWQKSCDYFDDDLESGYVRVFQELIAVGWSNPAVGDAVCQAQTQWRNLLVRMAEEFEARHGALGPFRPVDAAALICCAFLGAEALILVDGKEEIHPLRQALRRFGQLIAAAENQQAG